MQRVVLVAVLAFGLAMAGAAQADMIPLAITGVSAKAFHRGDNNDPGDGSLSRSVNGAGLTVGDPGNPNTWTHNARWQDNWQGAGSFANGATPGAWYVMDLGAEFANLDDLYIWNVREVLDRGTRDVALYYATNPTVVPATSNAYDFSSGGWTNMGNYTIAQATGNNTPVDTIIDLNGIPSARYIGFDIESNWGSTFRVGFAELQVTTPEPATLSLLGLGGLALLRRRRRKA